MTKQQRMAERQKAFQAKYKMTIEKQNDNAKVRNHISQLVKEMYKRINANK